jgi:hypothetical protein
MSKSNSDFIPTKDKDFLQWVINCLAALFKIIDRIGFPEAVYQALAALRNTFVEKFNAAEAPETRTKITITSKTKARKALEKALRQAIGEYINRNHLVTDEDREAMGLPLHKTGRTPSPVATTYPDYDIDSSTIRQLTVNFYDQGQKTSKAKPAGQHGAEIKWGIRDTPPASINDLTNSAFDTRTPFTLEFDETQRGSTVYFCLRWENTRGVKGPWSEIVSAIIP